MISLSAQIYYSAMKSVLDFVTLFSLSPCQSLSMALIYTILFEALMDVLYMKY